MEGRGRNLSPDAGPGEADPTAAKQVLKARVKGELEAAPQANGTVLPELSMGAMPRCKVRCFTDGAVIGSKAFVNEALSGSRERFGARRKDGARRMKGLGASASG